MIRSLLALASVFAAFAQEELLVQTTLGPVQGHYNYVGIREWNGIPYAQPPVGELRWEYPKSPAPWTSTYEASYLAPGCMQACNLPPGNCPEYGISEDCLYLTVMGPTAASSDPEGYPVFFWIHGGAFEQGLGDCALYNGTTFAQLGVVTVVINYRLGAFGFMASESMDGNYGFMDQRLALQWTVDNIAKFGGDPKRITIGGQSAGAMSVGAHMISKDSQPLFQQGIMESNPLGLPFHSRESAQANADACNEYLGCAVDDVECMRGKTAEEILDAQIHAPELDLQNLFINFLPWSPMVEEDGEIPQQPLYAFMNGDISQIPLLEGSVLDEAQLFVQELFTKPVSKAAYKGILAVVFGAANYDEIYGMYPFEIVEGSTDGRDAMNVLGTDLLFYCPLRNITKSFQTKLGMDAVPAYMYRFDHVMSFDCWGPDYQFCVGYVCHGSELPFVFNVFTDGVNITYTPNADEVQLTEDLTHVWTNFITHGNPNVKLNIPKQFPGYQYTIQDVYRMEEPGTEVLYKQREDYCDMWDRMGFFY